MSEKEKAFRTYQRDCIKAARDFFYPEEIKDAINNAKTETELIGIMAYARRHCL